jgi:hypothetical protein
VKLGFYISEKAISSELPLGKCEIKEIKICAANDILYANLILNKM